MGLYIKVKSYSINQLGQPVAYVVVKRRFDEKKDKNTEIHHLPF